MVVRAMATGIVRVLFLVLCVTAVLNLTATSVFAADQTKVALSGQAQTTGITACDASVATQSCLGQNVHFTATVTDQKSNGNGSPLGTVFFVDESGATIGTATLNPNGDNLSSNADFRTALLTTTGSPHSISATYQPSSNSWAGSSTSTSLSWPVLARATTVAVNTTSPTVAGTTTPLSASVTDAGPAPQAIDKGGNAVAPGNFFLATDGNLPTPKVLTLNTPRYGEAGAELPNDTVLIVGGADKTNTVLNTAELISNTVVNSGSTLNTARVFLTATTGKGGGRVWIVGGSADTCLSAADLGGGANGVLSSIEQYTIQTDAFAPNTDALTTARCAHTATRMNDGRILIAGGYNGNGTPLQSTEIFDPSQGTGFQVSAGPGLAAARAGAVAVLLQSGKVLIAGGDAAGDAEMCDSGLTACTMITGATMTVPRMFFAGSIMPDGNVLFAGGFSASDTATETAVASAEIYDVANANFGAITATLLNAAGTGPGPAKEFGSVLVHDGIVGFAGGRDDSKAVLGTIQAYTPAYTPAGNVTFKATSDTSDNVGGTGTPGPAQCTLDLANGTGTVACSNATTTTYHPNHVDTGTHTVEADYVGSANSAASTGTTNVTVNVTTATITAKDRSHNYGTPHVFSTQDCSQTAADCTVTGLINSDTVTVSFASAVNTATDATGTSGAIVPSGAVITPGADQADYTFTYVSGTMSVTPAPLSVTANNDSKTYGDTRTYGPGSTAFTSSGLQNSEIIGTVTITDTNSGGLITAAANGNYPLTPSAATGGTFTATNYAITYVAGQLTVNQAPLTITANNQTKVYGQTFTFTGNEFVPAGLLNGDTVTSVTLTSPGAGATATVISPGPTYPIVPSAAVGTGVSNYAIIYTPGAMTLLPAPAPTVTAKDQTKQYGNTFQFAGTEFTATGLLNSDTISSVTLISPAAAGGATVVAPGPTYPIIPSNATGPALGNYFPIVNYLPGTMTVNPAPLTVTANNQTKVYGNGFVFAGTEFTTGQLFNGDQVTSASMTSVGATPIALYTAGPAYPISIGNAVGTGLGNYLVSYSPGTMTLTQRPLPVTAVSGAKFYGTAPSFSGTQGTVLGQFAATNLVNGDTITSVTMTSPGQASSVAVGNYQIVPSNPQGSGLANYTLTPTAGTLTVMPATPGMRAEQISTKIDQASGGTIITVHVFLFNSNAPGANPGTGAPDVNPPDTATLSTSTIDIFDGTNKLNSSPLSLTKLTTAVPCSSGGQDCGVDATFTTAPLPFTTGSTHSINVAYAANQNFAAKSTAVGSVSVAASNIMGGANIPPMTSKSAPITIPNPEPLLTGQKYTLTCAIYSATNGAQMLATSGTCTTSAGSNPTDLSTGPSITVSVSTQVATSELRMKRLYDLSFTMPAFVLVGAGVPLVGLRRKVKRGKPLAWLGITLVLVLLLVAVGCGGNGFKNPNNVPVITQNSAQAGQYTIIVTATNTSSGNRFDVASLPFSISQ